MSKLDGSDVLVGALPVFVTFVANCSLATDSEDPYVQIYPPVSDGYGRTSLHFALALSLSEINYKSIGALPGVQIALGDINSKPTILPGYSLHYTLTPQVPNTQPPI